MHSSSQSRSRIFFEVVCVLAISASCVGAWMQTGASALLPAAAVAVLFGLVRAFDMAGRSAAVAVEPQRIDFASGDQGDLMASEDAGVPPAAADEQVDTDKDIEQVELVVPAQSEEVEVAKPRPPRKARSRRSSATKKAKVVELAPPDEVEETLPAPPEEVRHVSLEPLFEHDPFVRRAVFGRKAG